MEHVDTLMTHMKDDEFVFLSLGEKGDVFRGTLTSVAVRTFTSK